MAGNKPETKHLRIDYAHIDFKSAKAIFEKPTSQAQNAQKQVDQKKNSSPHDETSRKPSEANDKNAQNKVDKKKNRPPHETSRKPTEANHKPSYVESQLEEYKKRIRELENTNWEYRKKIIKSESEKNQLQASLDEIAKQLSQESKEPHVVQSQLEGYKERIEELENSNREYMEKITESESEKDQLQTSLDEIAKQLSQERKVTPFVQSQLEEYKERIQELENSNREYMEKLTESESEKDQLQMSLDEIVKQLGQERKMPHVVRSQLEEYKERIEELEHTNREYMEKIKIFEIEKDQLQASLDETEKQIAQENKMRKILLMSINQSKLHQVAATFYNMKIMDQIPNDVIIMEKKLKTTLSMSEADFRGAEMIVLVAVPEGRNMFISNTEPSQLGVIYREAQKFMKSVFMVYVDTKYSDSLKDSQCFHPSLNQLLESQTAVGDLAKANRFISIKIKEKENVPKITTAQCEAIKKWIKETSV